MNRPTSNISCHTHISFYFFIFLPLEEIVSGATSQKRCQSPPHQRAAAADLPPVVPRAAEISVFFPWTLSTRVSDSAVNLAPHQIEPPRRLIWQGSANYTPSVAMMSWWKAPVPKSSKPHYSPHSPRLRKISFSARALGVLHTHPCAHPICARSELAFCARSPRVYLCARALIEFEIQLFKEEKGDLWSNVTQEQKKIKTSSVTEIIISWGLWKEGSGVFFFLFLSTLSLK